MVEASKVNEEVAKAVLARAQARLDGQQKNLDGSRQRSMEVLKQAITLAGVAFTAAAAVFERDAWGVPATAGLLTAGITWIITAYTVSPNLGPLNFRFPGGKAGEFLDGDQLHGPLQEVMLSLAEGLDESIDANSRTFDELASRLRNALVQFKLAPPLGCIVGVAVAILSGLFRE